MKQKIDLDALSNLCLTRNSWIWILIKNLENKINYEAIEEIILNNFQKGFEVDTTNFNYPSPKLKMTILK